MSGDQDKKKQRNKRGPKGSERPTPRSKKRKKEEEERQAASSGMTHLKQVRQNSPADAPLASLYMRCLSF